MTKIKAGKETATCRRWLMVGLGVLWIIFGIWGLAFMVAGRFPPDLMPLTIPFALAMVIGGLCIFASCAERNADSEIAAPAVSPPSAETENCLLESHLLTALSITIRTLKEQEGDNYCSALRTGLEKNVAEAWSGNKIIIR